MTTKFKIIPVSALFSISFSTLKNLYLIGLILLIFSNTGYSQRVGFTDDFENGTLEFSYRGNQGNRPPLQKAPFNFPNPAGC